MKTRISGFDMYYEVHGSGRPVLLVHGFPLTHDLWTPLIDKITGYQLIMPDLRGHGESELGQREGMDVFADDLQELLEIIGVKKPVVFVGLSMGGYVAFEFYRRYHDSVRALVLADTRANADTPEAAQKRIETADRVLAEGSQVVADDMVEKLFGPSSSDELRQQWHKIMTATKPEGTAAALRVMSRRVDSTPTLSQIDVPTLIMVGKHDAITPPDVARTMHKAITDSRFEVIPNTGHMTPVEDPDRFATTLNDFLDSLS